MEKTHWKKVVSDPNYIGEADFEQGEEKILTIAKVNASETVTTAEGKSQKAIVHWVQKGNKPMILNVARSKSIQKVAGSPYFEDWVGVKVQLYIENGIKAFLVANGMDMDVVVKAYDGVVADVEAAVVADADAASAAHALVDVDLCLYEVGDLRRDVIGDLVAYEAADGLLGIGFEFAEKSFVVRNLFYEFFCFGFEFFG